MSPSLGDGAVRPCSPITSPKSMAARAAEVKWALIGDEGEEELGRCALLGTGWLVKWVKMEREGGCAFVGGRAGVLALWGDWGWPLNSRSPFILLALELCFHRVFELTHASLSCWGLCNGS